MELPTCKAIRLSADHALDGRIDKEDWKRAPAVKLVDTRTGHEPRQNTMARFGWTDRHFWAAFHCEDTAIVATYTQHDHPKLWTENVVEVYLDPLRDRHVYYELQVNCRNVGFDGVVHNASGAEGVGQRAGMQCFTDWNPQTYQHVVTGKGRFNGSADSDQYWDVELAIAFSDLYMADQAPPKPGDRWLFNAYRVDSGPWGQELYALSPTFMPDFHVGARFGTLEFLA